MLRLRQNQKGVTLVEALVAMAAFALALSLILGIMSNSMRQQRKVEADQRVASHARDMLEVIAREVRMGSIDYEKYLITYAGSYDLSAPVQDLFLINNDDQPLEFMYDAAGGGHIDLNGVMMQSYDDWINNVSYYISPSSDPFFIKSCIVPADCAIASYPVKPPGTCHASGRCVLVNEQPQVTIVLNVSLNPAAEYSRSASIDLQTTVTTRRYQR